MGVTASYLTLDGFVLELMHYAAPGATAPYRPRTMNEPGLTHLSISVDDVHATAERAVEFGGQIIEDSDIGAALFIRDPDGQLLELLPVTLPGQPAPEALTRGRRSRCPVDAGGEYAVRWRRPAACERARAHR